MADSSNLKSDAIMEQMKQHFATDAGKQLTEKIGLVYQFHIAPKKLGFDEVVYTVNLKKGEVTKGFRCELQSKTCTCLGNRDDEPLNSLSECCCYAWPYEGGKPDASFSFKDEDFVKVALGKMNPQIAFMRGAMKIKGSLSAAQKFTPDIFPKPSKL
ncbi:hypothetical protein ACSQ67_000199 [Phaseolus vulgaris]